MPLLTERDEAPPAASAAKPAPAVPQLVVASVPSRHPYVRHLAPELGPGPHRLPDADPGRLAPSPDAVRRPPLALDPSWARSADVDLFHLHAGLEGCDGVDPVTLAALVDVVTARGVPLVVTVHALDDHGLDVLVPAADAVLTLTPGAASEVERRWGRRAVVVPHPHVVPLRTMAVAQDCRARRRDATFRVGLHVPDQEAAEDACRLLPTLVRAVDPLPGAVLQVNVHRGVLEVDGGPPATPVTAPLDAVLEREASEGRVDLRVHDPLSEESLWCHLGSLDVAVLPQRRGTHSTWLEACRDLGTTVVAPTCGHLVEQGPVLAYTHDGESFDPHSLAAALRTAYDERPGLGAGIDERREQRARVAAVHDALYRDLVGRSRHGAT